MEQDQFGPLMEKTFKEALAAADAIKAIAEADREAARQALEAAEAAREAIEAETEKIVATYFEERRAQLITFTQQELLRQLALKHLMAGKNAEDIASWLEVSLDFVSNIEAVKIRSNNPFSKKTDLQKQAEELGNACVRYKTDGRGGTAYYESDEGVFDMWWEFGGGNALAIVSIPSEKHWEAQTNMRLDRRAEVLAFIGEQIIQDQASGNGYFEVSNNFLTIYK